jgi:hypothetical protein
MENNNNNNRIFANGLFVKSQKTNYGDIIKLSIKVEDFITFLNTNKTENGWISVDLLQKKAVDDKGRTHTPVLNNWIPNGGANTGSKTPVSVTADESSDLPF